MIYVTRPGDSAAKVAARLSGSNNADLAQQIQVQNQNRLASTMRRESQVFAPNSPIWIPTEFDPNPFEKEQIITHIENATPSSLMTASMLAQRGINLKVLAHAQRVMQHANQIISKQNKQKPSPPEPKEHESLFKEITEGIEHAYDAIVSMVETRSVRFDKFEEALVGLKNQLEEYLKAGTKVAKREARTLFKKAFNSLHEEYQFAINRFKFEQSVLYRKYGKCLRYAEKEGALILDTPEAKSVEHLLSKVKYLSKSCIIVQGVVDVLNLGDTYIHNGKWAKELVEDVAKIGMSITVGVGLGLIVVSGGWIVALAIAGGEFAANYILDKRIDYIGNVIDPG